MKPSSKTLKSVVIIINDMVGAGGAERLLLEEEKYFRNRGTETTVLTYFVESSSLFNYKPEKLEVIEGKGSRLRKILSLRRKLKEIRPDLVIAATGGEVMFLYPATLFTSIPYITHIHGTPFWFTEKEEVLKYALIHRRVFNEIRNSLLGHRQFIAPKLKCSFKKRVYLELMAILDYFAIRKARKIITLTDRLKWEIKKLYQRDSIVARGCLSAEVFSYQPKQDIKQKLGLAGKRIILNIGRLDYRKRVDILIEAFAKILPKYGDIYLVIGGTGEDEKKLKELTRNLDIEEKVGFVGFIPDSELYDYYSACDVFAFPSWTSSGITPYEALAASKKVVWTTEADEPVLGDSHVFLADPTVADFARGLEKALNARVEGKADLSSYTWDKYFETVYEAALAAIGR